MTEIQTSSYWLSSTALHVTLNAMGLPNYIQMNVSTGAVFACYLATESDLGFDASHNYKRWPLTAAPTFFNSTTAKYVYVAVPRGGDTSKNAAVVFPSERIDVYGKNADGTQVGSTDFYYVWLQATITASVDSNNATVNRTWQDNKEPDCGSLATEESFVKGGESTWWQWNSIGDTISFLKDIAKATFNSITIGAGDLKRTVTRIYNSVDGSKLSADKTDASSQDAGLTTAGYVNIFGNTHFLRKDADDVVQSVITYKKRDIHEQGIQFGEIYEPGDAGVGIGGLIDKLGNGVLESLKLRTWLEVPELRYNRATVNVGVTYQSFGGGIIESITPDATGTSTGTGTMKLEDGEIGAIAVGDLCMGIWHDTQNNDTETTDNKKGTFHFAGFKTIYMQITAVSGANNDGFSYTLRSTDEGGNGIHPFAGMHFAARGNTSNKERQAFKYTTTEYAVSLINVDSWEYGPSNYSEISGHIEGFSMPAVDKYGNAYIKTFSGYGQVFGNAYVFGQIDQFERVLYHMEIDQSLNGSMAPGETETITCTVYNGYGADITSQFTLFTVTRTTGDDATDAVWNQKHLNVGNPFQIAFSDLGIDGIHKLMSTFHVLATDEATGVQSEAATLDYSA